jgi:hypothetical protein
MRTLFLVRIGIPFASTSSVVQFAPSPSGPGTTGTAIGFFFCRVAPTFSESDCGQLPTLGDDTVFVFFEGYSTDAT